MVYEKSSDVDAGFWNALDTLEHGDVCRRSGASAARRDGLLFYRVRVLDRFYEVAPHERTVVRVLKDGGPSGEDAGFETALVILSHLTCPVDLPPFGKWVSEKELKDGSMFFRGVHALPLGPLLKRFGRDGKAFLRAAGAMGGKQESFGDASFSLEALPGIHLAFVLWEADEEFPARVSALFDAAIEHRLALDVVLALVGIVVKRLLEAAGE